MSRQGGNTDVVTVTSVVLDVIVAYSIISLLRENLLPNQFYHPYFQIPSGYLQSATYILQIQTYIMYVWTILILSLGIRFKRTLCTFGKILLSQAIPALTFLASTRGST